MAPKRNAGKIVRLGPPQAMMKRTIQRAAGEDIFCHCALQKGLVHDGHGGTLVALRKVPESTQQKSNWKIRRKVSGSTCSTGVTPFYSSLGRSAPTVAGVRVLGSVGNAIAGEGGNKSVPPSPKEMSTSSSPTFWCRSRAPAWSARLTDSRRAPPLL
jgi:hypothetical protein